jgi:hypothetical protein
MHIYRQRSRWASNWKIRNRWNISRILIEKVAYSKSQWKWVVYCKLVLFIVLWNLDVLSKLMLYFCLEVIWHANNEKQKVKIQKWINGNWHNILPLRKYAYPIITRRHNQTKWLWPHITQHHIKRGWSTACWGERSLCAHKHTTFPSFLIQNGCWIDLKFVVDHLHHRLQHWPRLRSPGNASGALRGKMGLTSATSSLIHRHCCIIFNHLYGWGPHTKTR